MNSHKEIKFIKIRAKFRCPDPKKTSLQPGYQQRALWRPVSFISVKRVTFEKVVVRGGSRQGQIGGGAYRGQASQGPMLQQNCQQYDPISNIDNAVMLLTYTFVALQQWRSGNHMRDSILATHHNIDAMLLTIPPGNVPAMLLMYNFTTFWNVCSDNAGHFALHCLGGDHYRYPRGGGLGRILK